MPDNNIPERPREGEAIDAPAASKRLRISPRAMSLALKNGADISKAVPTGPMGRIIERDIVRLLSEKTGAVVDTDNLPPEPERADDSPESAESDNAVNTENRTEVDCATLPADTAPESEKSPDEHISENTPTKKPGLITLAASFDATELLDLEKRLAEHGGEFGLPQITAADMIAFAAAKILSSTEYGGGEIAVRLRGYRSGRLCERYVPDARGLSLGDFAKIGKKYTDGNKSCLIDVRYLGELGIESFSPDPELFGERERILALTVGCVTNRQSADGRTYPSITLTLGVGGAELYRAAEYLDRLCRGLSQLGLTLII